MRHLWSFFAGAAAAPLTWVLIALGQDGSGRTIARWTEVGTYNTANLIESASYLAIVGIVLGLLGTLRVSPLGPLVAGLALVGPYVGYFVDPFAVQAAVPTDWVLLGDPVALLLPLENGTLFLIGALLLMAPFSLQRWRRWPHATAPVSLAPAAPPPEPLDDPAPHIGSMSTELVDDDPDVDPPTLNYPRPMPPTPAPLPRRGGKGVGRSPWSAPPRATLRHKDAAD